MKISSAFPSKYLKASDLQGKRVGLTIDSAELENIGDDEDKLVIYFAGKEKGLVCNRTNANMIEEILGSDETDDWIGKRIMLYPTKVDFQGKRVDAIRVEAPVENKRSAPPPPPAGDDDIPF